MDVHIQQPCLISIITKQQLYQLVKHIGSMAERQTDKKAIQIYMCSGATKERGINNSRQKD